MMIYKLTDRAGRTPTLDGRRWVQWGLEVTHSGSRERELRGEGYIYGYEHPLLALFLDLGYVEGMPRLWEGEGRRADGGDGIEVYCTVLTITRELPVPEITTEMRIRFALYCALEVCDDAAFRAWTEGWLKGWDRSHAAALRAAKDATAPAARAAARAAAASIPPPPRSLETWGNEEARQTWAEYESRQARWRAAAEACKAVAAAVRAGPLDLVALVARACTAEG